MTRTSSPCYPFTADEAGADWVTAHLGFTPFGVTSIEKATATIENTSGVQGRWEAAKTANPDVSCFAVAYSFPCPTVHKAQRVSGAASMERLHTYTTINEEVEKVRPFGFK